MGNKIVYKGYNVGETIQVSIMPTPTADNSGAIVQYVGATNANYINGYFYKCVSDGGVTPAYSWEEVDFGDSTPHWSGTRAEYEAIKDTLEAGTYVSITDDYDDGLEVVDVIENGNMNPVTSNAVYDAVVNVEDFTSQITFTNWNTAGQVSLRKCGKLVTFNLGGHLVSGQISTDINLPTYVGTIPANCLPCINAQFAAMTIGGAIALVSINASTGKIGMTCPSSATQDSWVWGSISYFTSN